MNDLEATNDGKEPDEVWLWTGPYAMPGRYKVSRDAVEAAEQGGEGLVYKAWDTSTDTWVALKMLTSGQLDEYGQVLTRAAPFAHVHHPNVMRHLDTFIGTALREHPSGDIDDFDVLYTVAGWIDGTSLTAIVANTSTMRLLDMVTAIARGLHALHTYRDSDVPLGLIHRDVKPSNIRVTATSEPVLIDFGVARPMDADDMTRGVGTYRWRAPEVLAGNAAPGAAIDSWGLGALAYWILVGEPPGLDGAATARERMLQAPRTRDTGDPAGVSAHVAVLLESYPNKRPANLAKWANELTTVITRSRRTTWRKPTLVAAGIALPALFAGGLLVARQNDDAGAAATDETHGVSSTTVGASATSTTAPSTTSTSTPSTTSTTAPSTTSTSTPSTTSTIPQSGTPDGALIAGVGRVWYPRCIGGIETTVVSGAAPGETFNVSFNDPSALSFAAGTNRESPIADSTGSFVIELHCSRHDIGTHLTLAAVGQSTGQQISIEVEPQQLVEQIWFVKNPGTTRQGEDLVLQLGHTVEFDIDPILKEHVVPNGATVYTGRDFDPDMIVATDDRRIAQISMSAGGWQITAVGLGSTTLTATTSDDLSLSVSVHVTEVPPLFVPEGAANFRPRDVATNLVTLLPQPPFITRLFQGSLPEVLPDDGTASSNRLKFFPACHQVSSLDNSQWTSGDELQIVDSGFEIVTVLTFGTTQQASEFAAAFDSSAFSRVGLECVFRESDQGAILGRIEWAADQKALEHIGVFSSANQKNEISIIHARNVVIVTTTDVGHLADRRAARLAALSISS